MCSVFLISNKPIGDLRLRFSTYLVCRKYPLNVFNQISIYLFTSRQAEVVPVHANTQTKKFPCVSISLLPYTSTSHQLRTALRKKLIPMVIRALRTCTFYVTARISGHTSNYYFGAAQLINRFCSAAVVVAAAAAVDVAFSYFHAASDQSVQKCRRTGNETKNTRGTAKIANAVVFISGVPPLH